VSFTKRFQETGADSFAFKNLTKPEEKAILLGFDKC